MSLYICPSPHDTKREPLRKMMDLGGSLICQGRFNKVVNKCTTLMRDVDNVGSCMWGVVWVYRKTSLSQFFLKVLLQKSKSEKERKKYVPQAASYLKCWSWSIGFCSSIVTVNRANKGRKGELWGSPLKGWACRQTLFTLPHFRGKLNHLFFERVSPTGTFIRSPITVQSSFPLLY